MEQTHSAAPETVAVGQEPVLTEIYAGILRTENNSDTIIPDHLPDVEQILLCSAVPRILEKAVGDETLEIRGTVTYQVLLSTEAGTSPNAPKEIAQLVYTEPFTLQEEIPGLTEDAEWLLIPSLDHVSARLVNPRKINLRSQTDVAVRIFAPVIPRPEITGTETLEDDMNLQRRYRRVPTAELCHLEETGIPVSQDLELSSNEPPIADIILSRVLFYPSEIRVRGNNAEIRTDAVLTCVYRSEENNTFTTEKKISLEDTVALPDPDYCDWIVTAVPGEITARTAPNSYGEMKTVETDFTYDLSLTGLRNREAESVTDMYSVEYETVPTVKHQSVCRLHRSYGTSLSVNTSVPRADVGAESVRAIFTGTVIPHHVAVTYQKEKNKFLLEGEAEIAVVAENGNDSEQEPLFSALHYAYPFRCELDAGDAPEDGDFLPECRLAGLRFRTDAANLYADLELSLRVLAFDHTDITYLSSLKLDKERPVGVTDAPLTLCYPSGDESMWDIAKAYRITEKSILDANGMEPEELSQRRVLLIPARKPKKPVFSKVV